jgi:uncharacterized protein YjbI with pentapeptide repeats
MCCQSRKGIFMRFEAKIVGQANVPADRRVFLEHLHIRDQDYSGRDLAQFCTVGCRLENCRFDGSRISSAQFGSGREQSEFVGCTFDGAEIDMGPGGCVRFSQCSFQKVRIRNWICFAVELVDCGFSGWLQRAIFNGTVPTGKSAWLGRTRNEFHGNDFSGMDLVDVAFRTGIDLSRQRLPSGPEYLYLDDVGAAIARARLALATRPPTPEVRRASIAIMNGLEKGFSGGQRQTLLRADNYYSQAIFPRDAVEYLFSAFRGRAA